MMKQKNLIYCLCAYTILLPYLCRLYRGFDWALQYLSFGVFNNRLIELLLAVPTFCFLGFVFGIVAIPMVLCLHYWKNVSVTFFISFVTTTGLLVYFHHDYNVAADAQAAVGLGFISLYTAVITTVVAGVFGLIEVLIRRCLRGKQCHVGPQDKRKAAVMMMSSKNQSGRGDGVGPDTVARPVKRSLAIMTAIIAAVAVAGVLLFVGSRSQARVINCPFAGVVSYLCGAFNTDLTQIGKRRVAWGPKFLETETQYFVEPSAFSPDQELRFRAWYYQIGGEDNAFIIRRLNDRQTEITVDQVIRFLAVFPKCTVRERRILNSIQEDLESETRTRGFDVKPGRAGP